MARILVIDDDEAIRNMLRRILEHVGHDVDEAGDGDLGVRRCNERPADLVITDIIMPNKEGIQTIQELRRDNPQIKIIAISGGGRVGPGDYLSAAKLVGADHTFSKPFNTQDVLATVDRLTEAH